VQAGLREKPALLGGIAMVVTFLIVRRLRKRNRS
jgi:hypothetical protein